MLSKCNCYEFSLTRVVWWKLSLPTSRFFPCFHVPHLPNPDKAYSPRHPHQRLQTGHLLPGPVVQGISSHVLPERSQVRGKVILVEEGL